MNGHTAVVHELLAKGAEVQCVVEGDLTTPLLLAAANGHAGAVQRLLEAGARVTDRDAEERSPLILAGLAGSAVLIKVGTPALTLLLRFGTVVGQQIKEYARLADLHPMQTRVVVRSSSFMSYLTWHKLPYLAAQLRRTRDCVPGQVCKYACVVPYSVACMRARAGHLQHRQLGNIGGVRDFVNYCIPSAVTCVGAACRGR